MFDEKFCGLIFETRMEGSSKGVRENIATLVAEFKEENNYGNGSTAQHEFC